MKKVIISMAITLLVTIASSLIISQVCFAQEKSKEKYDKACELGKIVVTATGLKTSLSDVPASISVIEGMDINMSPFEKTEDVLRAVAGVEVELHRGVHTTAGNRPVNVRGVGGYGDRTLVLVDGIPQNNANNGWVEWSQTPLDYVERIEVVRGPFSALYGSNAIGGVINIITKRPSEDRETVFEGRYGSFKTYKGKISQSQKVGRIGYYIGAEYEETNGYIASKPQLFYDIERYDIERNYMGKMMFDLTDSSNLDLGFSSYHANMGRGRQYFYGKTMNERYYANYKMDEEKIQISANFYLNNDKWDADFDNAPNYDCLYRNEVIPMQSIGGMIQAGINLADWNELSTGFDYRHNKVDKTDTYFTVSRSGGIEGKQDCVAAFAQDSIKMFDNRLILDFGGRYDVIVSYDGANWDTNPTPLQPYSNEYSSKTWSEISPKAGVVYHLFDKTTLRSSFGTGFKAPSLYELYTSLTRGKILIDSNPELKPEKAIAYDIGIEQRFLNGLCGTVTFYQSFAKDFIGYDMVSKTYWKRENISEVGIHGVETELKYSINSDLSCFANYTYNISKIEKYGTDTSVEGNYLPGVPVNKCAFGMLYANPKLFDFNLLFIYKGRTYADNANEDKMGDYATVDLRISKEFFKYFTVSLEIENLFDRSYVVAKGTDQDTIAPGRVITGVVNIKF